jgi:prophage tail gpP-like protein
MSSSDTIRLVIGGRDFVGFTEASISMAIDQMADTFSLSGPFDPNDAALKAAIEPYKDQEARIYTGDDIYLTGSIDLPAFSPSPDSRPFSLQGRSKTGILADCSVEPDSVAEADDLTFAQIARLKVCKSLGVTVRDDDPSTSTRKIPEARSEFGQTAFDFLHKLAAPHNLLLNSSFDGKLVITSADALLDYPIRASLEEGDPHILSVSTSFDASKRYSKYIIGTQFAGAPDVTGTATDPTVTKYRPYYKAVEEADSSDPDATAARLMAEAIASSLSISVTLDGWRRPDGGRWSERQNITLKYPSAYLYKAARYTIAGCTLSLGDGGYTTTLRLVPPEVYSSKIAKSKKKKVDLW